MAFLDSLKTYANWLHLKYPAGEVELLPRVDERFRTNIRGVYVVGDLAGVPLLKYSVQSGAEAIRDVVASGRRGQSDDVLDVVIIGAGASGMAAAMEADRVGLRFLVIEVDRPFATVHDFHRGKPIYTYPTEMEPRSPLAVSAGNREELLVELTAQTADIPVVSGMVQQIDRDGSGLIVRLEDGSTIRAANVVVAIGRSGGYRSLDLDDPDEIVRYRLHDPSEFASREVLVIGGGDNALETALALGEAGARVVLSYRREVLTRPKPANLERIEAAEAQGYVRVLLGTTVERIAASGTLIRAGEEQLLLQPEVVFAMVGRKSPTEFFRRSGIVLRNDWWRADPEAAAGVVEKLRHLRWRRVAGLGAFFAFIVAVFSWKDGGWLYQAASAAHTFPFTLRQIVDGLEPGTVAATVLTSMQTPSFYYTLAYSVIVVVFGILRVRRRPTPYIRLQTGVLAAIQVVPLFLLPEILLPYLGYNGLLSQGLLDALFPVTEWSVHGREYWRAYGFILAWPLLVYNVFTNEPLWWWLGITFVQTFVAIPAMIYFWGKGSYCGWICSCGALAETLGDRHRDKMPHGEKWNKLNMAGQVILALVFVILIFRILGWIWPGTIFEGFFSVLMYGQLFGIGTNYAWLVDVMLAGMIGYGLYFWFSGRVWCRFFCPLAALMHIYARFSRFRILAEKEKCISCNVCTTVCHQGIDVMAFAQQGLPMDDPQCVRCSACVVNCPTAVLSFGQVDPRSGAFISRDALEASLTRIIESERDVVKA
jgi:NosR/NirI family transcriptional regulator, nitrous oxide reductase regulator